MGVVDRGSCLVRSSHPAIVRIRVHFEWFPQEQCIVIGYCGQPIPFK